jgi:Predicted hydrolases or acyltransferases (alpha/beta hydrolase superfamily)
MKLFYRKYGNGPPLVILHGLYGSSDNWVTIAKSLSDNFTVYLPDQRNHGQSPHSEIHDYDSMRDDLFELVNDLKLKKFFLAGHSMGGKTAISFALKWPEMLNGLLIADISPFTDETGRDSVYSQHFTVLNAILSFDLNKISTRGEAESILSEKIPSEKVRGLILKNLQRSTDNTFMWKLNAPSLLKNLDKIMEGVERKTDYSQQITGFPVIFLKGGESDYIPKGDFRDIQKVFPAVEITVVPGAGHWIQVDKPDEVIKNLKKLLGDS